MSTGWGRSAKVLGGVAALVTIVVAFLVVGWVKTRGSSSASGLVGVCYDARSALAGDLNEVACGEAGPHGLQIVGVGSADELKNSAPCPYEFGVSLVDRGDDPYCLGPVDGDGNPSGPNSAGPWYTVWRWQPGAAEFGRVVALNSDGSIQFADGSESLLVSYGGGYVQTDLAGQSALAVSDDGLFAVVSDREELYLSRLDTGERTEVELLGSPYFYADSSVLVGDFAPSRIITWEDGTQTEIRSLFAELEPLPPEWLVNPQIVGVTLAGDLVYFPWRLESEDRQVWLATVKDGSVRTVSPWDAEQVFDVVAVDPAGVVAAFGQDQIRLVDLDSLSGRSLPFSTRSVVFRAELENGILVVLTHAPDQSDRILKLVEVDLESGSTEVVASILEAEPGMVSLVLSADGSTAAVSVLRPYPEHSKESAWTTARIRLGERGETDSLVFQADGTVTEG